MSNFQIDKDFIKVIEALIVEKNNLKLKNKLKLKKSNQINNCKGYSSFRTHRVTSTEV